MNWRLILWRGYLSVAGLVAVVALLLAALTYNEAAHEAQRIDRAIEPLCASQVTTLKRGVEQRNQLPPSFFPDIPPPTFEELVRKRNTEDRKTIRKLQGVCP